MAVTPLFTYVCGIQKKTTNHWVLAEVKGSDIRFMPWDSNLALREDIIVLGGVRNRVAEPGAGRLED